MKEIVVMATNIEQTDLDGRRLLIDGKDSLLVGSGRVGYTPDS